MQIKYLFSFISVLIISFHTFAQNDEIDPDTPKIDDKNLVIKDTIVRKPINPLAPSKAAFYSAILPGLGQAYNKKYWKIPVVYAALGTSLFFYFDQDKEFDRYRDALQRRFAGFTDDEFFGPGTTPRISNDGLVRAQRQFRRNRDLSLLITVGLYALNILDANIDAHLLSFNIDENLAVKPNVDFNKLDASTNFGLSLNFQF